MYNFEKLKVWAKSMEFCENVYKATKTFPKEEQFGLTSQLRRASMSIPLNIAEGSAETKREFIRFLRIALGSQFEVVTLVKLCYRLGLWNKRGYEELMSKLDEIGKLLYGLINSLKTTKSDN